MIRRIVNPLKTKRDFQHNLISLASNLVSLGQIGFGRIQSSHKRSVRKRGCLKVVSSQIPPELKLLLRFCQNAKILIPYCPMRNSIIRGIIRGLLHLYSLIILFPRPYIRVRAGSVDVPKIHVLMITASHQDHVTVDRNVKMVAALFKGFE